MDEGKDEHDAHDGDQGVRGLRRQKRVGVGEVNGGALEVELLVFGFFLNHLRVALLLNCHEG